jgi:hypothetical protein
MKNDLICDDLDKIKEKYSCSFLDGICWVSNELNYSQFKWLVKDMDLDTKFEILKKKLESNKKISEEKKKLNKMLLDEIMLEYNEILKNAKDKFHFSDNLIRQFDASYNKNIDKNGTKTIYRNLCKDAMESAIKYYIKYEKALILIVVKFYSISF